MKLHKTILAALLLTLGQLASAAGLQWYEPGSWAALRSEHASAPWVVHFWGMSCAPCRKEMPDWSRFMKEHPDLHITFIEVEQADPASVQKVLDKAGLSSTDQRLSSKEFDVEERFEIDKKWGGETPMTLLISPKGEVQKITGTMHFDRLAEWAGLKQP